MYRHAGLGTPTGPGPTSAPAGWWINPANPSQYLPQADAAKIGSYCMQGPVVGKYDVGGNYGYSVLFCKNLTCQESVMIYGGIAMALFLLGPGAWKWLGLLPVGYAALNCSLGGAL